MSSLLGFKGVLLGVPYHDTRELVWDTLEEIIIVGKVACSTTFFTTNGPIQV